MSYEIYIGDRMFSSWSLRGWLMLEKFTLPHTVHLVGLFTGTMAEEMAHLAPARLVPALRTPEGTVVGESLAIAETLAEQNPDAGLWPVDPSQRAAARWLAAEMVAGFGALRGECPMQLAHIYEGFETSGAVQADLDRIETLFAFARNVSGLADGYLFGDYSLAEVFYTPVAARIIGYGLPVSAATRTYCKLLLSDPAVLRWQEQAHEVNYDPEPYARDLPRRPWTLD
ncbi:glutathione S-transferase [Leisingera methylohalidivorans]|uniref:Glutathione S-transferase n=1 Tax=Leisingera methylohalidivorans DSM 14336 TaxID=999552 RepID=V9VQG7_9RHOB|nr:glutathione S-transferase [Leisingera methylohalidivorans]AHC99579.1 glutathione S-transferase [Leisingera methylohalidivorans DSM 14336]